MPISFRTLVRERRAATLSCGRSPNPGRESIRGGGGLRCLKNPPVQSGERNAEPRWGRMPSCSEKTPRRARNSPRPRPTPQPQPGRPGNRHPVRIIPPAEVAGLERTHLRREPNRPILGTTGSWRRSSLAMTELNMRSEPLRADPGTGPAHGRHSSSEQALARESAGVSTGATCGSC
jgi:hypothetical protein